MREGLPRETNGTTRRGRRATVCVLASLGVLSLTGCDDEEALAANLRERGVRHPVA